MAEEKKVMIWARTRLSEFNVPSEWYIDRFENHHIRNDKVCIILLPISRMESNDEVYNTND